MAKLLYLQASPREGRSHSRAVADAFVVAYHEKHPNDTVEVFDLFKAELPAFDGVAVQAKYAIMHGQKHSLEEAAAWARIVHVIDHFKSADKYLLAVPMWNFGVPYRFKQYLDIIAQPGLTFSYTPGEGYKGLVTEKPLLVVHARGGVYGPGSGAESWDLEKQYTEHQFGFMGFKNIQTILVEGTLQGTEVAAKARDTGIAAARELAATF